MVKSIARVLSLGLLAHAAAAMAQSDAESNDQPIQLEMDSISLDRKANVTTFVGLRIDAGRWSLVADHASARSDLLDFESGEWRFEGSVHVVIDTASVVAEGAVFAFRDQELVRGELWGAPVSFEDTGAAQDGPIVGEAERIRYDGDAGTIELLGEVTLTVGPYRTRGCDLVYFLGTERFTTGSADCAEPFGMIIPRDRERGDNDAATSEP